MVSGMLPVAGRHLGDLRIEENRADLAIAGTGAAAEDRAQHEGEPLALKLGQVETARTRPGGFADQQPMEAFDALDTEPEIVVERDQNGHPRCRCGVRQPETMIAAGIGDDDVATVSAQAVHGDRTKARRIKHSGLGETRRRSDNDDRVRNELGLPEGWRFGRRKFRIADER